MFTLKVSNMDLLILSEVSVTHSKSCAASLKGKSFEHREVFHSMLTAYFELNKGVHKSPVHSLRPLKAVFKCNL